MGMHDGHRTRMRDRFLVPESFEGFSDYDLLEMVLYYAKPRGDTNPLAHELLDRFGSLKYILEASVDDLCQVRGMGENSAIMFKLITEMMRRYTGEMFSEPDRFDTVSKVRDFLYHLFMGLNREQLFLLLFNDRLNLLDCCKISEGSTNSTNVPFRLIVEKVVQKKATGVILAHNHPNGVAVPSNMDFEVTDSVKVFLEAMDVTLIEHFIVSETRFWPIMRDHYSNFRLSPVSGKVESAFYENFYDLQEKECHFSPIFRSQI